MSTDNSNLSHASRALRRLARAHAARPQVDHNGAPVSPLPTYTYDQSGLLERADRGDGGGQ